MDIYIYIYIYITMHIIYIYVCVYVYVYIYIHMLKPKTIWFPMYINVCCIYQDHIKTCWPSGTLRLPVLSNRRRKRLRQSRKGVPLPEALEPKPGRKIRGVCPGHRCSFQLVPSLPWPIIDAIDYYYIYYIIYINIYIYIIYIYIY